MSTTTEGDDGAAEICGGAAGRGITAGGVKVRAGAAAMIGAGGVGAVGTVTAGAGGGGGVIAICSKAGTGTVTGSFVLAAACGTTAARVLPWSRIASSV